MEASGPIASDSFSYSWLSNSKSSLEGLEEPIRKSIYSSYGGTPEEFNYSTTNSDNSLAECKNFNFDTSITHSPVVHADELFSDGILRPVIFGLSKVESCNNPDPTQTKIGSSSLCSRTVSPRTVETHHGFLKRWGKSTQQILVYFLSCVNQLYQKVGCSRKSTRVDDIDKTEWQVKGLRSSQQASPKPITSHPIGDLHDHENSIYEAVLHCKRSVNKGELQKKGVGSSYK